MTQGDSPRQQRRAAQLAERRERNHPTKPSRRASPMLLTTLGTLIVGAVIVGTLFVVNGGLGRSAEVLPADVAPPPAALVHGRSVGDPAAPVVIDVWSDFQCPSCQKFAKETEPLLRARYLRDGTARLVYHDFSFLGQESVDAAIAARVAEAQGVSFWEYHDLLFANQGLENSGAFSRGRLADVAVALGLDRARFEAALSDPQYAAAVRAETGEGKSLNVQSTPTLVIGGKLYPGVPTWSQLSALIEKAAAGG
jgi:protein-disulfide isomerase